MTLTKTSFIFNLYSFPYHLLLGINNKKCIKNWSPPTMRLFLGHNELSQVIKCELHFNIIRFWGENHTLYREGKLLISFTLKQRPIIVAMLQCSTVGVNVTLKQTFCKNNSVGKQNTKLTMKTMTFTWHSYSSHLPQLHLQILLWALLTSTDALDPLYLWDDVWKIKECSCSMSQVTPENTPDYQIKNIFPCVLCWLKTGVLLHLQIQEQAPTRERTTVAKENHDSLSPLNSTFTI